MLKTHLKAAWRNLMKNKIFSFVNVIGLTIGLASFLLIALYIFDEMSFDRFHKNANHIYRLIEDRTSPDGKETKVAGAGYQVSEKSQSVIPVIKDIVRMTTFGRANISTTENTNVFYEDYRIGNEGFLTTFDFPLVQGDRKTALTEPYTVILTQEMAEKLFNTSNVIGKSIKTDRDGHPFKITGVLKNFPDNSHLSFDLLFSEASVKDSSFTSFADNDWASSYFTTYFLLDAHANKNDVERQIQQLLNSSRDNKNKTRITLALQPLADIHFYSAGIEGNDNNKGNITYIYVFSIVALFILLIACINYMNLATARFTNRAKEIAVRKVAGASRKNLVVQFLAEALLISAIALIAAVAIVELVLPTFNSFTGKQLTLTINTDTRIWLGILAVLIIVAILSGIYPALFQSRFKPLSLLKSKVTPGKGTLSIRRSLVVFQFSLSIVMIIATMVVYLQVKYLNTKDMGFNKEQMLVIDINSGKVRRSADAIKNEFLKLSQVSKVCVSSRVPGEWKDIPQVEVKNENIQNTTGSEMYFLGIDDQFLSTYQIDLLSGRNFYPNSLTDSSSVLINETAAKELGIQRATGQRIEIPSVDFFGTVVPPDRPYVAQVAGIVKDFNFQSLREPLKPMILGFQKNPVQAIDYFTAKVSPGNTGSMLDQMNAVLHGVDANHLFEYHFLDKQWDLFYRQDKIRQMIFLIMAVLAIIIACLGLFGLATYAAEQRIKEIGIRKVLGASVRGIIAMLSKDFLKLVVIASIIAFPIAWFAMNKWLQDFAYRINISWWVFVIASVVAILIALLTISYQAIRAAIANPVKSLRTE
jgi:putative ABC transport system permease protein